MDKQLEKWLRYVWKDRKMILMMSGVNMDHAKHKKLDEDNAAVQYVKDLIDNRKGSKVTAKDSNIMRFCETIMGYADSARLNVDFQGSQYRENVELADLKSLEPVEIAGRHFHFKKSNSPATHQLYLNIKEAHRLDAFADLCDQIQYVSGLCRMSIAAPGVYRTDPVILHTRNEDARRDIIDHYLIAFYRDHRAYFDPATPNLTKRVPDLKGVSTGSRPPDIRMQAIENGHKAVEYMQKFHLFRAMIVVQALIDTKERKLEPSVRAKKRFVYLAAKYLAHCGVNYKEPSDQFGVSIPTAISEEHLRRKEDLYGRKGMEVWYYVMSGGGGAPPTWGNPPRSAVPDFPQVGAIF